MAYEINININDDFDKFSDEPISSNQNTMARDNRQKGWRALGKYVSGQTITPIISNAKTMVSQQIGIVTGNKELQERVNFGLQLMETGATLYSTAQAGVVLASAIGLSGGLGLGIGALVGLAGIGINLAFNQQQINLEKRLNDYQIEQIKQRQGMTYNKSR